MKKKDERYYRTVLGVSPNASQKEIRRAYLNCVKYYHPDNYEMGSLAWENANKRVVEFNEAYAYLKSGPRKTSPQQPQQPRTHAQTYERQAPPVRKKPPTPEAAITAELSEYARAVLKKYTAILFAPSSVAFGAGLLAFLLAISGLLFVTGTTADHVAARIAYAFHPISKQQPYASGTLRGKAQTERAARLVIRTRTPDGRESGYFYVRLWSPQPDGHNFTVFIHAGQSAALEVPADVAFTLQYTYGRAWYGERHTFGPAGLQYQVAGTYAAPEESETEWLAETRNVIDIQLYRDRSSSVTDMQGRTQPSRRFRRSGAARYY